MLDSIDLIFIRAFKKMAPALSRVAIFIVFFWFGILKVLSLSPANPLVAELLKVTLPLITFQQFIIFFGIFEMIIGIAFLVPGLERLAIALLIPHMITTILPLVFLSQMTWTGFLVPTLEGQYIIKNLVIIALAFVIGSQLKPWKTAGGLN